VSQTVTRVQSSRTVTKEDVTIVLPVLNEEEGVAAVIDELNRLGYWKILVVDGYSTDMTVEVAKSRGVEFVQQHGKGKTGAINTAIERVSTPYVLVMDADFTYDASDIQKFLDHADHYDEIIGVRRKDNISRVHRVGNSIITRVFNFLFATKISDVCSGMYLLKTSSAKELELATDDFGIEVEVIAQVATQGRITEVPINYRTRIGSRKLSWKNGFSILSTTLGLARVYNPVFLYSLIAGLATIPGLTILSWVYANWMMHEVFYAGWALIGGVSILVACAAFIVGALSLLMKRLEARISRRIRENAGLLQDSVPGEGLCENSTLHIVYS
jgi:dolichol-phosphate mannosyltransferase